LTIERDQVLVHPYLFKIYLYSNELNRTSYEVSIWSRWSQYLRKHLYLILLRVILLLKLIKLI